MRHRFPRAFRYLHLASVVFAAAVLSCAHGAPYFPWIMDPARSALWTFIHDKCIAPGQGQPVDQACVVVTDDYVIDKPADGRAHFRVIPTLPITGIEDTQLWVLEGPNYWKAGLDFKPSVEKAIASTFRFQETQYGMAVNSVFLRSQDQLHIHLDCVHPSVTEKLQAFANSNGNALSSAKWTVLPEMKGETFRARLIDDIDLSATDPFRPLANEVLPEGSMLPQTLFVTDITVNGKKRLLMLNDSASEGGQAGDDLSDGNRGGGELLLDPDCRLLKKN